MSREFVYKIAVDTTDLERGVGIIKDAFSNLGTGSIIKDLERINELSSSLSSRKAPTDTGVNKDLQERIKLEKEVGAIIDKAVRRDEQAYKKSAEGIKETMLQRKGARGAALDLIKADEQHMAVMAKSKIQTEEYGKSLKERTNLERQSIYVAKDLNAANEKNAEINKKLAAGMLDLKGAAAETQKMMKATYSEIIKVQNDSTKTDAQKKKAVAELTQSIKALANATDEYNDQAAQMSMQFRDSGAKAVALGKSVAGVAANIGSFAGAFGELGKVPGLVAGIVGDTIGQLDKLGEMTSGPEKFMAMASIGIAIAQVGKQIFDTIDGAIREGEKKVIERGKAAFKESLTLDGFGLTDKSIKEQIALTNQLVETNPKLASSLRGVIGDVGAFQAKLKQAKEELRGLREEGAAMDWKTGQTGGGVFGWLTQLGTRLVEVSESVGKITVSLEEVRSISGKAMADASAAIANYGSKELDWKKRIYDLDIQIAEKEGRKSDAQRMRLELIREEGKEAQKNLKQQERMLAVAIAQNETELAKIKVEEGKVKSILSEDILDNRWTRNNAARNIYGENKPGISRAQPYTQEELDAKLEQFNFKVDQMIRGAIQAGITTYQEFIESDYFNNLPKWMQETVKGSAALRGDIDAVLIAKSGVKEVVNANKGLAAVQKEIAADYEKIPGYIDTIIGKTQQLWGLETSGKDTPTGRIAKDAKDATVAVKGLNDEFYKLFGPTITNITNNWISSYKTFNFTELTIELSDVNKAIETAKKLGGSGLFDLAVLLEQKKALEGLLQPLSFIDSTLTTTSTYAADMWAKLMPPKTDNRGATDKYFDGIIEKIDKLGVQAGLTTAQIEALKASVEYDRGEALEAEAEEKKNKDAKATRDKALKDQQAYYDNKKKMEEDYTKTIEAELARRAEAQKKEDTINGRVPGLEALKESIAGTLKLSKDAALQMDGILKDMAGSWQGVIRDGESRLYDIEKERQAALDKYKDLPEKWAEINKLYDDKVTEETRRQGEVREKIAEDYAGRITRYYEQEQEKLISLTEKYNERLRSKEEQLGKARSDVAEYVTTSKMNEEEKQANEASKRLAEEYEKYRKAGMSELELEEYLNIRKKELTAGFTENARKKFDEYYEKRRKDAEATVRLEAEAWDKQTKAMKDEISSRQKQLEDLKGVVIDTKKLLLEAIGLTDEEIQKLAQLKGGAGGASGSEDNTPGPPQKDGASDGEIKENGGKKWRWNAKNRWWEYAGEAGTGTPATGGGSSGGGGKLIGSEAGNQYSDSVSIEQSEADRELQKTVGRPKNKGASAPYKGKPYRWNGRAWVTDAQYRAAEGDFSGSEGGASSSGGAVGGEGSSVPIVSTEEMEKRKKAYEELKTIAADAEKAVRDETETTKKAILEMIDTITLKKDVGVGKAFLDSWKEAGKSMYSGLHDRLKQWIDDPGQEGPKGMGERLVRVFADGIKQSQRVIIEAVEYAIINPIKDRIKPGSPPKKGELSKMHLWMPSLIQYLASTMNPQPLEKATDRLVSVVSDTLKEGAADASKTWTSYVIPKVYGSLTYGRDITPSRDQEYDMLKGFLLENPQVAEAYKTRKTLLSSPNQSFKSMVRVQDYDAATKSIDSFKNKLGAFDRVKYERAFDEMYDQGLSGTDILNWKMTDIESFANRNPNEAKNPWYHSKILRYSKKLYYEAIDRGILPPAVPLEGWSNNARFLQEGIVFEGQGGAGAGYSQVTNSDSYKGAGFEFKAAGGHQGNVSSEAGAWQEGQEVWRTGEKDASGVNKLTRGFIVDGKWQSAESIRTSNSDKLISGEAKLKALEQRASESGANIGIDAHAIADQWLIDHPPGKKSQPIKWQEFKVREGNLGFNEWLQEVYNKEYGQTTDLNNLKGNVEDFLRYGSSKEGAIGKAGLVQKYLEYLEKNKGATPTLTDRYNASEWRDKLGTDVTDWLFKDSELAKWKINPNTNEKWVKEGQNVLGGLDAGGLSVKQIIKSIMDRARVKDYSNPLYNNPEKANQTLSAVAELVGLPKEYAMVRGWSSSTMSNDKFALEMEDILRNLDMFDDAIEKLTGSTKNLREEQRGVTQTFGIGKAGQMTIYQALEKVSETLTRSDTTTTSKQGYTPKNNYDEITTPQPENAKFDNQQGYSPRPDWATGTDWTYFNQGIPNPPSPVDTQPKISTDGLIGMTPVGSQGTTFAPESSQWIVKSQARPPSMPSRSPGYRPPGAGGPTFPPAGMPGAAMFGPSNMQSYSVGAGATFNVSVEVNIENVNGVQDLKGTVMEGVMQGLDSIILAMGAGL